MTPSTSSRDLRIEKQSGGVYELNCTQWVPRPIDDVFAFFSHAGNLQEITPPFLQFHVLTPEPIEMKPGSLIDYRLRVHGLPMRWRSRIERWNPPHGFVDVQVQGPYRLWHHEHRFSERDGGTIIADRVRYRVPGGALINRFFVQPDVERIFRYRQQCMEQRFGASTDVSGN